MKEDFHLISWRVCDKHNALLTTKIGTEEYPATRSLQYIQLMILQPVVCFFWATTVIVNIITQPKNEGLIPLSY